jgi:hypothetical protein
MTGKANKIEGDLQLSIHVPMGEGRQSRAVADRRTTSKLIPK